MIVSKWLPANHGHPVSQARPKFDQSFLRDIMGAKWARAGSRSVRAVASTSLTCRAQRRHDGVLL